MEYWERGITPSLQYSITPTFNRPFPPELPCARELFVKNNNRIRRDSQSVGGVLSEKLE